MMPHEIRPDKTNQVFSPRRILIQSFLLVFIPTSLIFVSIFFAFSHLSREYELQAILIREGAALKSAEEMTSLLLEQQLSDLMVLAEGETLREYLHNDQLKNWAHLSREFALFARRKPHYKQIRYLDVGGHEQVRVNNVGNQQIIVPRGEMQNKAQRYYFKRAVNLSQGQIYVSQLDLNIDNGEISRPYEPTIRFATPVFDGYGVKQGIVIINYEPRELFQRLADLFEPMTGDAMVLNHESYWLMGSEENKLWGFMFDNGLSFSQENPDAWAAMSETDQGTFGNDKGMFVFRKVHPLHNARHGGAGDPALPQTASILMMEDPYWIFVSQISSRRIKELTANRDAISTATYLILFLITSLVSWFFAQMAVQKRLAYRKLEERAVTDDLTGIANRRELHKSGQRELLRAQRFRRPLSLMLLDLDHFKRVNDSFGHVKGDKVLKHVTAICQSTIRLQDLLARYGGEEFVVLMPETDLQGAREVAARIRINVGHQPYPDKHGEIPVTVSIGISTLNPEDQSYEQIIARADKALYLAKERGRNRVEVMTESKAQG